MTTDQLPFPDMTARRDELTRQFHEALQFHDERHLQDEDFEKILSAIPEEKDPVRVIAERFFEVAKYFTGLVGAIGAVPPEACAVGGGDLAYRASLGHAFNVRVGADFATIIGELYDLIVGDAPRTPAGRVDFGQWEADGFGADDVAKAIMQRYYELV